jgi:hypothetical protein
MTSVGVIAKRYFKGLGILLWSVGWSDVEGLEMSNEK